MDMYQPIAAIGPASAAHYVNPLEQLYVLERDLAASERRTTGMLEELNSRLDRLETRVSAINGRVDRSSRQLEGEVLRLADRIASLEEITGA